MQQQDEGEDTEDAATAAAVDEDIYFRDKRNSVGLKSADECHFTSCTRSKATPHDTRDNDEVATRWESSLSSCSSMTIDLGAGLPCPVLPRSL